MIRSFLSSVDSDVGLNVFKIVAGYFKSLTRTMMSLGFWNYLMMYCFRFSPKFLYLSLDFICLEVVPKTVPKFSTSPLKFPIDYVYAGRLKHLTFSPYTFLSPHPVWPPWPCPCPPVLALDSLIVSEAQVIVVSLLSQPLLPTAGEAVSVSGVIVIYLFFWILLNSNSYHFYAWDITPRVCNYQTR